jgi:pyruvate/2-oxoglutarate dehydrogenase complex dihydrolipoamide acyltransferase (E2) component
MVPGVIGSTLPVTGQTVTAGQTIFEVQTMSGDVPVTSMTAGTVWQVLADTGAGVTPSDVLATVLPTGSDASLLVAVAEESSGGIAVGQQVVVQGRPNGAVSMITPPLPVSEVAPKTGLTLEPDTLYTIVTVDLADPVAAGTEVSARIVLSDTSVLNRILGF